MLNPGEQKVNAKLEDADNLSSITSINGQDNNKVKSVKSFDLEKKASATDLTPKNTEEFDKWFPSAN